MDDKLVILAGSVSSRMKKSEKVSQSVDSRLLEEAVNKSKAMIGVGNDYRPFFDYLLFNARMAGYRDFQFVLLSN